MKKAICSLLVFVFPACGIAAAQKANKSTAGGEKIKIELLYFNGCPSYKKALENIKAVLKEKNLKVELILIRVETEEEARKVGFQGSPSVRINGKDLEGRDEGYSFSCRLYRVNGKPSTAPGKEAINARIESLMK